MKKSSNDGSKKSAQIKPSARKNLPGYLQKNTIYYLLLIFVIITIIKVLMSFAIPSPFIMWDEALYDNIAHNVLQGKLYSDFYAIGGNVPPGYSMVISIAYLLSNDKKIIYHLMLVINALITTAIIFPSYFILKKYCSEYLSLAGAFLIAILPSVFLYTFTLWSENLFITLFMFSIWFLIESYETNNKIWEFFAAFSVVFLYITRATGMAMMLGFVISFAYYCYARRKDKNILLLIKEKWLLISTFILTLGLWLTYTHYFMPGAIYSVTGNSYNAEPVYLNLLIQLMGNVGYLVEFVHFIIIHIDYIMITTYFIAFFIVIYMITFGRSNPNQGNSLQISFLYFLSSLIMLLIVTSLFMFDYFNQTNSMIYGRYIDPVIPVAFLYGILGINVLFEQQFKAIIEKNSILIISGLIVVTLIVLLTMVHSGFFAFDEFSTLYLFYLNTPIIFYGFIILMSIFALCPIVYSLKNKKHINQVITVVIITSTILSMVSILISYKEDIKESSMALNDAIVYIREKSTPDMKILINQNDIPTMGKYMWGCAVFWGKGMVIPVSDVSDQSIKMTYNNSNDYILSRQILPYQKIANGLNDVPGNIFKLYNIGNTSNHLIDIPYKIDFKNYDDGIVDNFEPSSYQDPWTMESSQILIEYPANLGDMNITILTGGYRPENNSAHIEFYINNYKISEGIKQAGNAEFSFTVPQKYLYEYYQILDIRTNIWIPSDYGLKGSTTDNGDSDDRHLGITINSITVNKSA